jgi:hypothetical protein
MLPKLSWIAVAVALALAPTPPALAEAEAETESAPGAEAAPETQEELAAHRQPPLIWDEMLAARDEIHLAVDDEIHLAVDQEDMETVARQAIALNDLKREFYASVEFYMDMDTQEKRIPIERRDDLTRLALFKRSLNFIWVPCMDLVKAANTGVPGKVRAPLDALDRGMTFVETQIPEEFRAGSQGGQEAKSGAAVEPEGS